MFKHACGIGLEEIFPKVRDSRYQSGRGFDAASAKKNLQARLTPLIRKMQP